MKARRRIWPGLVAVAIMIALAVTAALLWSPAKSRPGPIVLAAASLQEAMTEATDAWVAKGHARPRLSFAASSALARQAANGAPADLFVSADEAWMDDLERRGTIAPGTRATFLANRLVLVAAGELAPLAPDGGTAIASLLGTDGRLAMADPDAVPAGRYGKAALQHLGQWQALEPRIARAENVRAALALVERGAAPIGIVYATDAAASDRVRVVGTFPEESHPPIRYPLARLQSSTNPDAEAFRQFLMSPDAAAIFRRHGFVPVAG